MTNGNGIWKWVAGLLAALLLGMFVQSFREAKDPVTQKEMSLQLLIVQAKIDALSNQVTTLQQEVSKISEKMNAAH